MSHHVQGPRASKPGLAPLLTHRGQPGCEAAAGSSGPGQPSFPSVLAWLQLQAKVRREKAGPESQNEVKQPAPLFAQLLAYLGGGSSRPWTTTSILILQGG